MRKASHPGYLSGKIVQLGPRYTSFEVHFGHSKIGSAAGKVTVSRLTLKQPGESMKGTRPRL